MSDSELHELIFLALAQTDMSFQFWLTITFAVIVVAFLASHHLSGTLVSIISVLYLLTTTILISRIRLSAQMYRQYIDAIEEFQFPREVVSVAAYLRPVVLVLGTVSALAFLFYRYQKSKKGGNGPENA